MTRRQLTIITGQPLPNFIAVHEPSTTPEVLHCIYTRGRGGMDERLDALRGVLSRLHPDVRIEPRDVDDPYAPQAVDAIGRELLRRWPDDQWALNATSGTKPMSAALERLFHGEGRRVFYVDTDGARLLDVRPDWSIERTPFERSCDVETYFELFGQRVMSGEPTNGPERQFVETLRRLDFQDVRASVTWNFTVGGTTASMAEYDAMAIADYRLFVFERKRLSDQRNNPNVDDEERRRAQKRQAASITHDLQKLAYTRALFGGPFGRVFWVISGGYPVSEDQRARFRMLGVTVVPGSVANDLEQLSKLLGRAVRRQPAVAKKSGAAYGGPTASQERP